MHACFMLGNPGETMETAHKTVEFAKEMNADIFHSAIIRKGLDLTPRTVKEADRFFDYRNNLREDVDRKVYSKLAEKGLDSLKSGRNVVLDAGYFFKWQRQLVYDIAKEANAEVIAVRVVCSDEKEIKKRMEKRAAGFGKSALNETPSWGTYLATKEVTESFDDEELFEKWDWKIATRKLDKETILDNLEHFARFIDWKYVINEIFSVESDLSMDKELPRIAACLSVVNRETRKDIWKDLTAKIPFETLLDCENIC